MAERIEGEFHYAERMTIGRSRGATIYRTSDGEQLDYIPGRGFPNIAVTARLKQLDETARHFIQQGEEKREAEINTLADKDFNFAATRDSTRVDDRFHVAIGQFTDDPDGCAAFQRTGTGQTLTEALRAASSEGGEDA